MEILTTIKIGLAKLLITPLILLMGVAGYPIQAPLAVNNNQSFGAFNPSAGGTYRLQSSIGTTDTSVSLSSFKEPISGAPLTMTYMNTSIAYATIDPQNTSRKELISFTGVTQNADGSALLTGVTRGLSFNYPFTASSTLRQAHPGQSILILSDSPQLFSEYATKQNYQEISGPWLFSSLPTTSVACTSGLQFCNKTYIDGLALQGAPTSTENTLGLVELGTAAEASASTASSTEGRPLVLLTRYATSTPMPSTWGSVIPVTNASGQINSLFIATSSSYTWTGSTTFKTATTSFGATTSISAIANIAPLRLNGVDYGFPGTSGLSGQTLQTDGNGNLSWAGPLRYTLASTSAIVFGGNTYGTSTGLSVPQNVMKASSTIQVVGHLGATSAGTCTVYIRNSSGATFVSATAGNGTASTTGRFDFIVQNNGTEGSQRSIGTVIHSTIAGVGTTTPISGSSGISTLAATSYHIVGQSVSNADCTLINFSMIIEP